MLDIVGHAACLLQGHVAQFTEQPNQELRLFSPRLDIISSSLQDCRVHRCDECGNERFQDPQTGVWWKNDRDVTPVSANSALDELTPPKQG